MNRNEQRRATLAVRISAHYRSIESLEVRIGQLCQDAEQIRAAGGVQVDAYGVTSTVDGVLRLARALRGDQKRARTCIAKAERELAQLDGGAA